MRWLHCACHAAGQLSVQAGLQALRHAGRFTDVRLRSHRAAQADDMARYARHAQSLADADSEDGDATDPDYDPAYDDGQCYKALSLLLSKNGSARCAEHSTISLLADVPDMMQL